MVVTSDSQGHLFVHFYTGRRATAITSIGLCHSGFPSSDARKMYVSLAPSQIRLLRLHPDAGARELGTLEVVDLPDAPPYYAISHSWTNGRPNGTLYLGGCWTLALNVELLACVRRLCELSVARDNELSLPIEYVWIDNICINQADPAERSSQVALMRRIYQQSIRTLIWLGCESQWNDSCEAWPLLDDIYTIFREQNPTVCNASDIPVRMFSQLAHDCSGLPSWDHHRWEQLRRLMELRWFSRIWVVQEVALSTQDPVLLHGKCCYSWSRFGWAVAWLRRNGYMRLPQIPNQLRNVDTMTSLQQAHKPWPLDALMSITQVKFHASDQRDKIYGLLGLAAECQDDSAIPDELMPDYSIDLTGLYCKIARYLLRRTGSLALLTRARGSGTTSTVRQRRMDLDLPSWCPDWSDFKAFNEGISISLSWVHDASISQPARLGFPIHYAASSGLALVLDEGCTDEDDPTALKVRGIRLGLVSQVIPFDIKPVRDRDSDQHFSSQMARIVTATLSLLRGDEHLLSWTEKFIKATTAEQHSLGGRDWDQSWRDGLAYFHRLFTDSPELVSTCMQSTDGEDPMPFLRQHSSGGVAEHYETLVRNFGFDRAFFITSDGRMGIGPSSTRQGDTISVLLGGGVPYCIRRQDEAGAGIGDKYWLFVGESYVEGLLRGEAICASQQSLVQEEKLCFR